MLARLVASPGTFCAWLRRHFGEAFLPALCVASIVTVLNHHTAVFDPLNAVVFAEVMSRVSYEGLFKDQPFKGGSATVISIDQDSYSNAYGEQAPLNRCQLKHDLAAIYAAQPAVLVIDIDLSPARWLRNAPLPGKEEKCDASSSFVQLNASCQAQCERDLYTALKARRPTKTILMLPLGVEDIQEGRQSEQFGKWFSEMEQAGLQFGDPSIVETFGIVLHMRREPASFATLVCNTMKDRPQGGRCVADEKLGRDPWINAHTYFSNIKSLTTAQLTDKAQPVADIMRGKAVFFGRESRQDDQYLTPVGTVNGVEIHAASFLTLTNPVLEDHLRTFAEEVFIAILFGALIDFCWRRYFHARFSSDARLRLAAPAYVFGLACAYVVLVALAWVVSWYRLGHKGIWASPIELAVGMLIEAWIRGTIKGAVHASFAFTHDESPKVKGVLESMTRVLSDVRNLWNKVDDPERTRARIQARMRQIEGEMHGLEATEQANAQFRYRKAAVLLGLYRIVFTGAVFWCLVILMHHHLQEMS